MPWCPKCRTEYVDGIAACADCGRPLVDYDPNPATPEEAVFGPMLLITVASRVEAEVVRKKLAQASVDCLENRLPGADKYDIYVMGALAYRKARDLLDLDRGHPGAALLITAADQAEAEGMEILLGSYNIPIIKEPARYGNMIEIMVAEGDYDSARELLELDAAHLELIVAEKHREESREPAEESLPAEEDDTSRMGASKAGGGSASPGEERESFNARLFLIILAAVAILFVLLANPIINFIRSRF